MPHITKTFPIESNWQVFGNFLPPDVRFHSQFLSSAGSELEMTVAAFAETLVVSKFYCRQHKSLSRSWSMLTPRRVASTHIGTAQSNIGSTMPLISLESFLLLAPQVSDENYLSCIVFFLASACISFFDSLKTTQITLVQSRPKHTDTGRNAIM